MKVKKKKKRNSLVRIVLFSILFLSLVQIVVSHRLSTAGKLVAEYELEASDLRSENTMTKEAIDKQGSLASVYEKALALGFKPIKEVFYLPSEVPVALGY